MAHDDLTLHIEGHPGHRGNALAHALSAKLRQLLSALGQAERRFAGRPYRMTDYEISGAGKTNPTHLTLHPVPRIAQYDPLPAFEWTMDQFERVASGRPVDDRVDAALARTLAEIAEKKREGDYKRLWISVNGLTVPLDDEFRAHSEALAARKFEIEKPPRWFQGVAYGSVTGDLRQVADIEGEHQFVILPPVGAQRITCTFPEEKREKMREFLFRTVRVVGRLKYAESSPFPIEVEMEDIEPVSEFENPPHLLDLRGLFKGRRQSRDDLSGLLHGL